LQLKRIALLTVLGLLAAAAVAAARTAPEHHPTTLGIERVDVSPDGAITVTGGVESDIRRCELRAVVLKRAGGSGFLDVGFTSFRGHVWSVRSKPGVADGSEIVVVAPRVRRDSFVLRAGRVHHRRVVCDRASLPVDYIE
jgi:hypothetical protein